MFEDNLERELTRVYNDLDDVFATYMVELDKVGLGDDAVDIIENLRQFIREVGY